MKIRGNDIAATILCMAATIIRVKNIYRLALRNKNKSGGLIHCLVSRGFFYPGPLVYLTVHRIAKIKTLPTMTKFIPYRPGPCRNCLCT